MSPLLKTDRYGIVYLKEWAQGEDGRSFRAIAGRVILQTIKDFGIPEGGKDSTWALVVCDPENTESCMIAPGCQIRTVRICSDRDHYESLRRTFNSATDVYDLGSAR